MTIDPKSSGVLGYSVFGYMVLGEPIEIPAASSIQDVEIIIFDDNMDAVGRLKNCESFQFIENWYQPHTFEIRIDTAKLSMYQLLTAIKTKYHVGYLGSDGQIKIAIVEDIQKPKGAKSEQWVITGRSALAVLERRKLIAGYSALTGTDTVTDIPYETAARYYIDRNCINAKDPANAPASHRVIAGISLETVDQGRIPGCSLDGRGQGLLDIITTFSQTSGLSFDLAWIGASQSPGSRYLFEFRTLSSRDLRTDVKLSTDLGNILSFLYEESVLGYSNAIYVAGTGDGASRVLQNVYSGTEPTGKDRFEDYIDASDCSTSDQVTQRGNDTLAQKSGTKTLDFDFNTVSQSAVYGVDFRCGDIVTVVDKTLNVSMIDRVISVTTTYDAQGKKIKIGMGTAAPDLVDILGYIQGQNTGVRR
jgi:hypothetical protein